MASWSRSLNRCGVACISPLTSIADRCRCLPARLEHTSTNATQHIVRSQFPDGVIPNLLLHEYLLAGLDKWHDKTAFQCLDTQRKLSYAEVNRKSDAFAGFLRNVGLQKGDAIAIVLINVPEYFVALIGAMKAGVAVTTINPEYTAGEIKKQLIDCHAKLVVTLTGLCPTIREAADAVLRERHRRRQQPEQLPIVAINHTSEDESPPRGCVKFDEVTSKEWPGVRAAAASVEDVCLLPYSSGTTGLPKGVQLTHRNVVANSVQRSRPEFKFFTETHGSNQDVVPIMLPMFHMYGLGVIAMNLFAHGVKLITLPKFTIDAFGQLLRQGRLSVLFAVPPMILMLLNNPSLKLETLSDTVRILASAAAPLGAADMERFHHRTNGNVHLLQIYGMTEITGMSHCQSLVLPHGVKVGGSGVLLPNTQCKICPPGVPNGAALGPHQSGELLLKGPQLMKGYLNNEEANREAITADGWMRSGDIAHYDEDGHFFITDRLKELIKVKGFQVAPAELEEVLRSHPDIADAAVVGVPHPQSGEAPRAFVVLRPQARANTAAIHAYMRDKVVDYKQLAGGIALLDAIPKTASGKILRHKLRNL